MIKEERFTAMFQRYNRLVRGIVLKRTESWELSEEICQQVFLKYFEKMEYISDEFSKSWLVMTTKNKICDYFRKQYVYENVDSVEEWKDKEIAGKDDIEQFVERMADKEFLRRVLEELYMYNNDWHEAIVLTCVLDMPYAKAAQHLGISQSLLRARISRGRKYIRQRYGEEYETL